MNYFKKHWKDNFTAEIPKTKIAEAKLFLQPLVNYQKTSQKNSYILDAGSGDGVHIEVLSNMKEFFDEHHFLLGLDISLTALLASQERRQKKLTQSDISQLPFKEGTWDIVFSFGVLAYTADPFASFSELCRVTRSGGLIGIWIYPKNEGLSGQIFSLVRKFCQLGGTLGTRLIADSIVPFLGVLPTRSRIHLGNASWRQCREVVLVNIAPQQLSFPTLPEVKTWFKKNNIKIIHEENENPITLWGEKC